MLSAVLAVAIFIPCRAFVFLNAVQTGIQRDQEIVRRTGFSPKRSSKVCEESFIPRIVIPGVSIDVVRGENDREEFLLRPLQ